MKPSKNREVASMQLASPLDLIFTGQVIVKETRTGPVLELRENGVKVKELRINSAIKQICLGLFQR